MRKHLVSWQWQHYPTGHRDRGNLLLHLATVPVFYGGLAALIAGAAGAGWPAIVIGLAAILAVVVVQGRGHRREASPPIAFLGASDVISRLLVEQLVTLPRFLLSGGWARAWRAAATPVPDAATGR